MNNDNPKILVLLDIDNTLIHALSPKEMEGREQAVASGKAKLRSLEMQQYYTVFERPNLDDFLDFAFKHCRVAVWTAASKEYALFVVRNCILKGFPGRKLEYFFCAHHCKASRRSYKGVAKHLDMLTEKWALDLPEHVVLVDDLEELATSQVNNKVITVKPFFYDNHNAHADKELLRVKSAIQKLLKTSTTSGSEPLTRNASFFESNSEK